MKKIVFAVGKLKLGGIQNVLIRYVNEFVKNDEYKVEVLVKEWCESHYTVAKEIDKRAKITILKPEKITKMRKNNDDKDSFIKRAVSFFCANYEDFMMKKRLEESLKKENNIEAFIDISGEFWKYIAGKDMLKIGMVHIDPKGSFQKNPKDKIKRFSTYDKVILISKDMRDDFLECYPFAKDKIVDIYNPIDIDEIKRKGDDYSELNSFEQELIKEKYILGVSMLNKRKARDELIDAFKNLKNRGFEEKLILLGDGPERKNLENHVKKLKLENEVFLLGMKNNPYVWMKHAKVMGHPSYSEGFGYILAEAMVFGKVSVSYDCPVGPSDVLERGSSGVLVKMGDKKGLEDGIEKILTDAEYRGKIEKNIEKRVIEFSAKNSVEKLEKVIENYIKS